MTNRLYKVLIYALIAMFLASAVYVAAPAHAFTGTVALVSAVDGSRDFNFTTAQKSVGDTFIINLTVTNAVNLSSWQVGIQWDTSMLDFVDMSLPSDNILAGKNPLIAGPDTSTPGLVVMGAGAGPGKTPFTGNGRMAQLTLKITQAPGAGQTLSSNIVFEGMFIDTFLLDNLGSDITSQYDFQIAHYNYKGPAGPPPSVHDVAVTNVAPASSSVINGSSLNIAVTVANTGNFSETFPVQVTANSINVAPNQTVTGLAPSATQTLTFVWDTTGLALGDYTLSALADLPGDPTPADNTLVYGVIHIISAGAGHDVGVTEIVPRNPASVGQGFPLNVSVTVTNNGIGGFNETFDVTIYANGTNAAPKQTVNNLSPGQNATLTFTWNTAGWTIANYTLSATADLPGDPTPADNTLVYGNIYVMLPGDVNNDGVVNMRDVQAFITANVFNSFVGRSRYQAYMDVDASGRIEIRDLLIICINFNKKL